MAERIIRASDVGEYVRCHRAWWLGKIKGVPNANREQLDAGTERHRAHGQEVQRAGWMQRAGAVLLGLALIVLVVLLARVAGIW